MNLIFSPPLGLPLPSSPLAFMVLGPLIRSQFRFGALRLLITKWLLVGALPHLAFHWDSSAGASRSAYPKGDLSLLPSLLPSSFPFPPPSLPFSHWIIPSIIMASFIIFRLMTPNFISCSNPFPDTMISAASWMIVLGCPEGTSELSMSSVGLRLFFLPCLFWLVSSSNLRERY